MKKILLAASGVFVGLFGFAQNQSNVAEISPEFREARITVPIHQVINQNPQPGEPSVSQSGAAQRSATETEIGDSKYDLQTNSAIQRRIVNHGNGTISAVWTYSSANTWTTRGTGYNFYNGTSWGTAPTAEIETERTGWPNLLFNSQGSEIIIAHNTANDVLRRSQRGTIGTGTWTQDNLQNIDMEVWSRAVIGGPNNNTIHLVGMTLPEANDGTIYNGMDGAFLYSRSTNGGQTWDINNYQIPGTDVTYYDGFDGDSYHIEARGNTVAIVVGALGRGVQLFKSTNNGVSWTKTDVLVSEVWFDEATSNIPDDFASSLFTSDGSVNVLIDDNNVCHVVFGGTRISNGTPGDDLLSFFPGTNQIDYWNDTYPGPYPQVITGALDLDGNGQIDLLGTPVDALGQYRFSGMATQPSLGVDANGCLYMSYTAVREDLDNGAQHYRHTYVTKSCDDGCSWTEPIDVTGASTNDFSECVFPSIAKLVDSDVHILYMSDNEPGIAVSGDEDPVVTNKMMYLTESAATFDNIDICPAQIVGDSLFCPGATIDLFAHGCATSYSWSGPGIVSGGSTQTVTVDAIGVYTCTFSGTACGTVTADYEIVAATGTGPGVQVSASTLVMCPGDASQLMANSNTAGSVYLWSTGATTAGITVNSPGSYTVTVADCNGQTTETVTIVQPQDAPSAQISGDPFICTGETVTLEALPVSGGSYLWSTGSTAVTTQVTAAGTYTVTVTNCGGTSTTSFVVATEAAPVATINASATEVCEGETINLTAGGGTSYEWSSGETSANINPTSTGTYTVTVSNDCGDTDVDQIAITINPKPAQPTITQGGGNLTATGSTGNYQWYVNGVAINGATAQTLAETQVLWGKEITVVVTDPATGCTSDPSEVTIGVDELADFQANTQVYPNPAIGQFEIRFGEVTGSVEIQMTNAVGQVVYSTRVLNANKHLEVVDLEGMANGVYNLSLKSEAGVATHQVVVR